MEVMKCIAYENYLIHFNNVSFMSIRTYKKRTGETPRVEKKPLQTLRYTLIRDPTFTWQTSLEIVISTADLGFANALFKLFFFHPGRLYEKMLRISKVNQLVNN